MGRERLPGRTRNAFFAEKTRMEVGEIRGGIGPGEVVPHSFRRGVEISSALLESPLDIAERGWSGLPGKEEWVVLRKSDRKNTDWKDSWSREVQSTRAAKKEGNGVLRWEGLRNPRGIDN